MTTPAPCFLGPIAARICDVIPDLSLAGEALI
jgi:hypothetical protein